MRVQVVDATSALIGEHVRRRSGGWVMHRRLSEEETDRIWDVHQAGCGSSVSLGRWDAAS